MIIGFFFFFKQKTAYEIGVRLVGSEMCIRDRMGRADGPKPAIEALNRASGHVRTEVSKKMHIRKAPRFIFVEDDGAAYAAHINELLRELNVNGDSEQPSQTEE